MANEATLEVLNTAYNALLYAGDFMASENPRDWIRKSNILLDACLDAGMSYDEPSHENWAAERLATWLLAA